MMETQKTYLWRNKAEKMTALLLSFALLFTAAGAGSSVYAAEKPERPQVSAKSGIVIDGETGSTIYSKNPHTKRDPYSITKLLTCLVALEHLSPEDTVTVTKWAANTGGSTAYLKAGEKVRVKDLIYAALLPSGNDAAVALAHGVSGSKAKFAVLMNKKAKELGCTDSHFSNPHGWKAKDHYTSAYDMAKIAKAAMEVALIRTACSTEMYKMPKTNKHKARYIATTNYLVAGKKYPKSGVFAGKTGTWDSKNASLVSACQRKGKLVYAVVLKDTTGGRYTSTNRILNYSYKKLEWMAESENKTENEKKTENESENG